MMKKLMMKYLILNCRQASLLTAKKEEGRLSFKERMQLAMHTTVCSFCRNFEKQGILISKECKTVLAEEELPREAQERMGRVLNQIS